MLWRYSSKISAFYDLLLTINISIKFGKFFFGPPSINLHMSKYRVESHDLNVNVGAIARVLGSFLFYKLVVPHSFSMMSRKLSCSEDIAQRRIEHKRG